MIDNSTAWSCDEYVMLSELRDPQPLATVRVPTAGSVEVSGIGWTFIALLNGTDTWKETQKLLRGSSWKIIILRGLIYRIKNHLMFCFNP